MTRPDRTEPEPLTRPQARALGALARLGPRTPSRPVAVLLWPDSPGWQRTTRRHDGKSGGYGATMPMKAAAFLHRLERRGLVRLSWSDTRQTLWTLTSAGRRALDGFEDAHGPVDTSPIRSSSTT